MERARRAAEIQRNHVPKRALRRSRHPQCFKYSEKGGEGAAIDVRDERFEQIVAAAPIERARRAAEIQRNHVPKRALRRSR